MRTKMLAALTRGKKGQGKQRMIVWLMAAWCLLASYSRGAESTSSLAGVYRDEQLTVELKPAANPQDSTGYAGTIQMGERKFPIQARAEENRLTGTFESEGARYPFSGSVVGRMLVLTTDGTTYRLTREQSNPLARPTAKPNPLAQPRTNATATPALTTRPAPPPLRAMTNVMRFSRYSVMDDPALIGGDAFSLLLPSDWIVEGGVAWRLHPIVPAYLAVRVTSLDRTESVETFPALMFVWAEGGIPLYPPGSIYLGNEVAEPIEDPVAYIKQVVLPRFRKNVVSPRVLATEEMPSVAQVIAQTEQEPGLQKNFRAARVRIEYVENGRTMQEDIYCVLASAYAPATHTTLWGADRNYAFKAEKGKLDVRANIFQTVLSSYRPNLVWFNRYVQLVQLLAQGRIDGMRHPIEFGPYIKQGTTDEISELRRKLYDAQQTAQERVNASFLTYVRGLDEYRNPLDHRRVLLPASAVAWTNRRGDYLLAGDASFDPKPGAGNDWLRVEVAR